jgi:Ser-tRNA(Ala) deacylase AlaX
MATQCLFREDSYLKDCGATVVAMTPKGGIVLNAPCSTRRPAASRRIAAR